MAGVIDLTDHDDYTPEELDFLYQDVFFGADQENTNNLLEAYYKHNNIEHFLRDEKVKIPMFPTTVCRAKDYLNFTYDIDGVVIELTDTAAVKSRIHYMFLGKLDGPKLPTHWNILKKHLPIHQYSEAGISALHKTYGHTLGFVDGGYMLHLSVASSLATNPHPIFQSEPAARANAAQIINSVFALFVSKLKNLGPEDLQRPTLQHTNFNDIKKIFILEQDQSFVLGLLMQAIKQLNTDPTQTLLVFMTRFGQKCETPLSIASIVNRRGIRSITCHAACSIKAKDPRVDLYCHLYDREYTLLGFSGGIGRSASGASETLNRESSLLKLNPQILLNTLMIPDDSINAALLLCHGWRSHFNCNPRPEDTAKYLR
ncbi:hypothetical protein Q8A67_010677 [Cirrhinus molitorella]|uniref:Uncharacterized protein n=1 Tax=Cirrhinus molitorella TaxID=172907 RepID=A0AA88PPU7_9TELE|nr:hypothetical protein Q8A67_010677 [Cirrhinus molitorella]